MLVPVAVGFFTKIFKGILYSVEKLKDTGNDSIYIRVRELAMKRQR
tara:strand:+ start:1464 stop:1601 length:138 start_codon:yes stop_codon:yes gene_type:complete